MMWAVVLLLVCVCVSPVPAYRCSVCPAGKYKSAPDFLHRTCLDCEDNTYSGALGATACVPCGLHSSAARGSSTCACDAGYAKTGASVDCSGCSNGLLLVDAKCECPSGSSGPTSGPCALCAAGKFQAAVGRAACEVCPMHTYQTQTGARNCTACPGALRAAAGSTSPGMCECGVGFLQRADDTCEALLPRFVEVRLEMQTSIDAVNQAQALSVASDAIKEAILLEWTNQYNVSREYLIVEVVAIVESGRELLATYVRFEIVVRRIFPADTAMAYVDAGILTVSNFSADDLVVILFPSIPSRNSTFYPAVQKFTFEIIGTITTSAQAIEGTLNLKSNEVVACTLIPWNETFGGTSWACDIVCNVEREKVAVAFVDGLYNLSCVDRRLETTTVQTTPEQTTPVQATPVQATPVQATPVQMTPEPLPVPDKTVADMVLILTVVGVGVPAVLVTLIFRLRH